MKTNLIPDQNSSSMLTTGISDESGCITYDNSYGYWSVVTDLCTSCMHCRPSPATLRQLLHGYPIQMGFIANIHIKACWTNRHVDRLLSLLHVSHEQHRFVGIFALYCNRHNITVRDYGVQQAACLYLHSCCTTVMHRKSKLSEQGLFI